MPSFYPPVLENKARAIPFIPSPASTDFYEIEFAMPSINVVTDIGHIQVSIKYQSTNESAVNPDYSPDRAVLYIKRSEGGLYFKRKDNGNYLIQIPYRCFEGGRPKQGTTYIVQVRFGLNTLWDQATNGLDGLGFQAFAAWRNLATSQVPSAFGEWSNLQTVYCYGEATESLEYNLHDFVPELVYNYAPVLDDPLEQVRVVYEYADMYGSRFNTLVFNGQYQQDGSYSMKCKLPIAPVQTIFVSVEATTKNNTVRGQTITIYPLKNTLEIPVLGGKMEDAPLTGEESKDGVLAKQVTLTYGGLTGSETLNLYRSNVYTLETIKVITGIAAYPNSKMTLKDFSVEMGEDYQYIACYVDVDGKVIGTVVDVYDWGYENPGYARLMDMDATVFLTTRKHQLRLQGGVNVTSLKRNTNDNFQTTIGSKYPYYSRNGQMNYRTFSLQGMVSINFDPTASFMRNDKDNGLWWDNDSGSKLVVLNRDLYGEVQFSLSRRRTQELARGENESISMLGGENARDVFGPKTVYDNYYYRNITTNLNTAKTGENFYIERKFREFVMEWLSDGKPKLFRSETEGNMIVMITAATFTPQDKSARMTYSMSCTVTEIAEYNLENLEAYDLIPCDIKTEMIEGFPTHLEPGDYISEEDYLTIIVYEDKTYEYFLDHPKPDDPTLGKRLEESYRLTFDPNSSYNAFSKEGNQYLVLNSNKVDLINKILKTITEYRFIRGDEDPNVYTGLIYQFNKIYNIPNSIAGQEIKKIDTSTAVRNQTANVISKDPAECRYSVLIYSVSSGQLPEGLTLNPRTGVISGKPVWPHTDAPRPKDSIELKVTEYFYHVPNPTDQDDPIETPDSEHIATMTINVGYIYSELQFDELVHPDGTYEVSIPVTTVGEKIQEVKLYPTYVRGGVKLSQMEDSQTTQDYIWSASGLPAGLSIDQNGVISGAYLSAAVGGIATITVSDGVGQTKQQIIHYGDGVQQIFFQDSLDYNLDYSEVGVPIEEVDVSGGVTGGYPTEDRTQYIHGYKFSQTGLPPGLDIDEFTGVIKGTPTQVVAAGSARITATDFHTPTPTSASIDIVYQQVLEKFVFEDSDNYNIDPYGGMDPINLGLVLDPGIYLMDEEGKTGAVHGGLKYNDPPYYRFSAKNLLPDFSIDNYGHITGRASVASEQRTATIYAYDARGKEQSIEIEIVKIISKLSFRPPNQITIPEMYVGPTETPIHIEIPFEYISGGTDPYDMSISELPTGMKGWTKVNEDGSKVFIIEGKPSEGRPAQNAILTITDDSPEKETITYNIACGQMVDELTWNQAINLQGFAIGEDLSSQFEGGKFYIQNVIGGKSPYTLKVTTNDWKFAPLYIGQDEGGEQNPNGKMYIAGQISEQNQNESYTLTLTDASGQQVQNVITVGLADQPFTVKAINSLNNVVLVAGKSRFTGYQIMQAEGGSPGTPPQEYKYCVANDYNLTPFDPGVTLNQDNAQLSGTIQNVASQSISIGYTFYAYDNGGLVTAEGNKPRQAFATGEWSTPIVYQAPKVTSLAPGNKFTIPLLTIGEGYNSGTLISAPSIPGILWELSNPNGLPPGLVWTNGAITGTVKEGQQAGSVQLICRIPASIPKPGIVTDEIKLVIDVTIEGVFTTLSLGKPTDIDYDYFKLNEPIQQKNVASDLAGGVGPYTWTLEGAPAGITLNKGTTQKVGEEVLLQGQCGTEKAQQISFTVKVTDSTGAEAHYVIYSGGVYKGFTFTDSAAMDIPAMKGSQNITEINCKQYVSGGSGNFTFTAENISPYSIDSATGIISGNSGTVSQLAKIGKISAKDLTNLALIESVEINVGQITADFRYFHKDTHDIPAGSAGTSGTVNLSDGVIGGTTITYAIKSLPTGWTASNAKINNPSKGIINYTLPRAGTAAGQIIVSITDAVEGTIEATIATPAIG